MADRPVETSPQVYARVGGILYLIIIAAGLFGEAFVRNKLIVSGDAAATAHNIMASQPLWRLGLAGDLIMHMCDVPLTMIFFVLLRPVQKNLALLAAFFTLVQTAILCVNKLSLLIPLFLLGGADYLKAFDPQQLQVLAYLSVKMHGYGFGVGLIFFGCACLVLGHLIFRSGYLPKALGILMQIAGVCYLINSFALLVAPALTDILFPAIMAPAFVGELSLCLWLLVKGVNVPKWEAKQALMRH
ncbi:MAG TPA: DUF4386 domain-containing protein [Thermoanaerobaculia bacterium]|jgi:hypothetical protein|nr:DUF4386 domain-containing protein [Thermoanaerobaculia bacterium]